MKISGIENLDIGMNNIEIEGEVTYAMTPRNVTGDNEKGHYDFWSQFVVIDDGTGKIGCSVSIEKEEYKLRKEVVARVKGKLEEYKNKDGEIVRKIKGKLIAISRGDKVTDVQQEVAEEYFEEKAAAEKEMAVEKEVAKEFFEDNAKKPPVDKWEAKDLRIARECAIKAVTELVANKIMESKDFFVFANTIVKYIYNGKVNNGNGNGDGDGKGKKKVGLLHNDREPLKVIDKDGPFPGEPTKEELDKVERAVNEKEDIPGSSINNAIPFRGKAKAN